MSGPQLTLTNLLEYASVPGISVDRDRGIVRGLKVHGWESRNGRKYLPEGVDESLYEGKTVFANHPKTATGPRANDDALGVLRNVRKGEDGLYADFHYLKSHPLIERILEDIERRLGLFGCSHNAQGHATRRGGMLEVDSVHSVRSVDIVTEPATVTNLWESKEPTVRTTLGQYLETLSVSAGVPVKGRQALVKLLEAGELPGLDAGLDLPPPPEGADIPADPGASLTDGFRQAIDDIFMGEGTDAEKLKKIRVLIQSHSKAIDAVNGGSAETPESDYSDEGDEMPEKVKEAIEPARLDKLIKLSGKQVGLALMESLRHAPEDLCIAMLEQLPGPEQRRYASRPQSAAPAPPRVTGGRTAEDSFKRFMNS